MSAATTLIAVVGERSGEVVRRVAAAASNVGAELASELPEGLSDQFEHLRGVWGRARRRSLVYTLVDADPLAPLVEEWRRRLLGEVNELELAIAAAGRPDLPDYYLVDEQLPPPRIDWYLAHLRSLAPSRVVPVKLEPGPLLARLASLPYGRPFPPGAEVAASAREFVPLPELVAG